MSRPLYDGLRTYSKTKKPFHMPGHKFGRYGDLDQIPYHCLDATEASGLDNLYEADGIIREAMVQMADFCGATDTLFLTNGSTAGILTSILAVCQPGDQLLIARNCHHSVWSGMILAGVIPIYISPERDMQSGVITHMSTQTIKQALDRYPCVKGALIVSPTYEGMTSPIQEIGEVLHQYNKILIVDEAHGAHFPINEVFPKSSTQLGADLVIQSMHKTLPNLTQSGLLHRCSERVTMEQLVNALKMVQTSSPSYMIMAMMDYVRADLIINRERIDKDYVKPLLEARDELKQLRYLKLLECDQETDVSKIVILTQGADIDGYTLAQRLEASYEIVVESALEELVILMTTVADSKESLAELVQALLKIDATLGVPLVKPEMTAYISGEIILGQDIRAVHFDQKEWIELSLSEGRTLTKNIMLYPPGIPIACIGEEITLELIKRIRKQQNKLLGIQIEAKRIDIEVRKIK
ncbi:MAG: aminotransferase class I/II-fold pyridoxal phosphate-dependent enzyme [Cellulosilyticaceae bacterium]